MSDSRLKLAAGAVFLLPIVLVKASAVFLGTTGSATQAAVPQPALAAPDPAAQPADRAAPTAVELAAADHVALLDVQPFGPTPLFYSEQVNDTGAAEPGFAVEVIMSTDNGPIAVINGKTHHVGDRLGDTGWRVFKIDSHGRAVIIHDPDDDPEALRYLRMGGPLGSPRPSRAGP